MVIEGVKRRFTVSEYHRMAEAGVFAPNDRVELIDGEILRMTPIGREHMACVDRLNKFFSARAGDIVQVRVQGSVVLDDRSEPEPDLALLSPRHDFYSTSDARPEDVLLLVEVADSSLAIDTTVKVPLYARSRIREVWLVDLVKREVVVHRGPTASGYSDVVRVARAPGVAVAPAAIPACRILVEEILDPPRT